MLVSVMGYVGQCRTRELWNAFCQVLCSMRSERTPCTGEFGPEQRCKASCAVKLQLDVGRPTAHTIVRLPRIDSQQSPACRPCLRLDSDPQAATAVARNSHGKPVSACCTHFTKRPAQPPAEICSDPGLQVQEPLKPARCAVGADMMEHHPNHACQRFLLLHGIYSQECKLE